jgi:hypothetical protein
MEPNLKARFLVVASLVGIAAAAGRASAYVEVQLDNGQRLLGTAYQARETTLLVYTPAGAVEVERSKVRAVDEHAGNLPPEAMPGTGAQGNSSPATGTSVMPSRPEATSADDEKDPKIRDQKLARQLIFLYRDRAMAMNNKDKEAADALNSQIKEIETKRYGASKKPDTEEPRSANSSSR